MIGKSAYRLEGLEIKVLEACGQQVTQCLPVLPGEARGGGKVRLHPLLQHKPQGDAAGRENSENLL